MRYLIKDPKPQVFSFVCPVTQKCSLSGGCAAAEARLEGYIEARVPQAKWKCECGKNLIFGVLSDGVEVTRENLNEHTK